MVEAATPLVGKLLIAMPTLADPNFWHTVVLVGVHSSEEGAFGLVINRPLDVELADILDELGEPMPRSRFPQVLAGGPVEPNHGFVIYEKGDAEHDELPVWCARTGRPPGTALQGSTPPSCSTPRSRSAGPPRCARSESTRARWWTSAPVIRADPLRRPSPATGS